MVATRTRSIRAPEPLWAALEAVAERAGRKANALAVELIEAGLRDAGAHLPEPQPKAKDKAALAREALRVAEAQAEHLAKAKPRAAAKGRQQASGAPAYWKGALANVQEGPSFVVPGSRLKGANKRPSPRRSGR